MPDMLPPFHSLALQDLRLFVRLGCESWERAHPQEVLVSVEFRFAKAPQGVLSDDLAETVCYAQTSKAILEHCESREYQLIEKLAYDVYRIAKSLAPAETRVQVKAHKLRPPVSRLSGGSVYHCGDFVP